ncbi:hypothetical protein THIOM_003089 [Candidatus Thiomargarita nelsonii]|uniref:Uncharacterized protein n=1 Tax=Candidatus Thiomargarita nelsonii TaxID=1003181 RepID=A0A176RZF8_9GAMM|nr:hypothetical protein THIOM_003089 [Candidatus Thiomargarita nelsonii]
MLEFTHSWKPTSFIQLVTAFFEQYSLTMRGYLYSNSSLSSEKIIKIQSVYFTFS